VVGRAVLVGVVCALWLAFAQPALAATWAVSDTTDTPVGQACPGFTNCSLREAITSTENNPGPDAILISAGTYPLTNGELAVTQDLTVSRVGAGAATISGSGSSRIFDVTGSGTGLAVRFLTLTHGSVSGAGPSRGGAILGGAGTTIDLQSATVSNSAVSAASGDAEGGAIYSQGSVTIETASGSITGSSISGNSAVTAGSGSARGGGVAVSGAALTVGARTSISGNSATNSSGASLAEGGGAYLDSGATFTQATVAGNIATGGDALGGGVAIAGGVGSFVRSTVSGNTSTTTGGHFGGGGGIATDGGGGGSISLQLSTVSGNTAETTSTSGAVAAGGGLTTAAGASAVGVSNSTIASNAVSAPAGSTARGAGVFLLGGTLTIGATILAENTGSAGSQCDSAALVSTGYDILGPLGTCSYSTGTGDVTGVTDAGLKTLGGNGGLTQTILLASGSPALDVVPSAVSLCSDSITDQRGVSRPQNGACDSGAVEMRPATLVLSSHDEDLGYAPLSTPATGSVFVSNTGELDAAAPTATLAAPFSASGCTSTIAGGSSCSLDLQFAPVAGGSFTRTLQVVSGSASDTAIVHGIGWAPTGTPLVRGTPSVGYKGSVATGRWPANVAHFTAQWIRCDADGTSNCGAISGAVRTIYRPVLADMGHTLRVRLSATSTTSVESDAVTTAASPVVTRTRPTVIDPPEVKRSSAPAAGTTLYAYRGQWTGAPDSYTVQWVRCDADGTSNCADLAGRTASGYTPGAADVGHTLRVRITATNPAGTSAPATSAPTGVVS